MRQEGPIFKSKSQSWCVSVGLGASGCALVCFGASWFVLGCLGATPSMKRLLVELAWGGSVTNWATSSVYRLLVELEWEVQSN